MKITDTVSREIVWPACPVPVTRQALRELAQQQTEMARKEFPGAGIVHISGVISLNKEERCLAEQLIGFVWAHQFEEHYRADFGAFEHFRFKWKH